MGTTIGEFRESLIDTMEQLKTGDITPQTAVAVAKVAAQVSTSLQIEADIRLRLLRDHPDADAKVGQLTLGDESPLRLPDDSDEQQQR